MLARLSRELPRGALTYEPKWDGFRCLAFVDDAAVDLRSRHDRPLARYFPEVVEALTELRSAARTDFVLDGELIVDAALRPDAAEPSFADLMSRLHPAPSRVERLARETPGRYVAFDLLAEGDADLRERPYLERRDRLAALLAVRRAVASEHRRVSLTPATRDAAEAARWFDP